MKKTFVLVCFAVFLASSLYAQDLEDSSAKKNVETATGYILFMPIYNEIGELTCEFDYYFKGYLINFEKSSVSKKDLDEYLRKKNCPDCQINLEVMFIKKNNRVNIYKIIE